MTEVEPCSVGRLIDAAQYRPAATPGRPPVWIKVARPYESPLRSASWHDSGRPAGTVRAPARE
jgi:hypothetical protein